MKMHEIKHSFQNTMQHAELQLLHVLNNKNQF